MPNTSNLLARIATYKRRSCLVLSATTFIILSPLAQAQASDTNNLPNAFIVLANYCDNGSTQNNASIAYAKQQKIDCLLTQLSFYQQQTLSSRQQYFAYKAQALFDYASYENSKNNLSVAGLQALKNGTHILKALQKSEDKDLPLITAIPSSSALMRPDLWAMLSALKDSASQYNAGTIIAPRELAFSEVALIWAATDQCQSSLDQSGLRFRMAERWLEQAHEAYVNTYDSKASVALEDLMVSYYEQYAPLDAADEVCRGQPLPL